MNDRHKRRIYNSLNRSNAERWVACFAAARLSRAEVAGVAKDNARTPQTIRNMRAAGRAFQMLRPYCAELATWAKRLGYTHFGTIGHILWRKRQEGTLEHGDLLGAIEDLRMAYQEGVNIVAFNSEMVAMQSDDPEPWRSLAEETFNTAERLRDHYGVPRALRSAAQQFCTEYQKWAGVRTNG